LDTNSAIFREVQRFRQWWVLLLVLLVASISWYGFIQQIVLKKPFGDNPAPDSVMIIILVIFGILFPLLFYSLKLITEVRFDGLYVKFFPLQFHSKKISFGDIKSYEIRTYSALKEYGGYGIRLGPRGNAYNVSGNKGIQLEFQDGKQLLVGTQKPEEFFSALNSVVR
jgi:hypothetical protein